MLVQLVEQQTKEDQFGDVTSSEEKDTTISLATFPN